MGTPNKAPLTAEQINGIEQSAKFEAQHVGGPGCATRARAEATLRLVAEWREHRAQHGDCTCSDGTCPSCKHDEPNEAHRHAMFEISQKLEGQVLKLQYELRSTTYRLEACRTHLISLAKLVEHIDNEDVRRVASAALCGERGELPSLHKQLVALHELRAAYDGLNLVEDTAAVAPAVDAFTRAVEAAVDSVRTKVGGDHG